MTHDLTLRVPEKVFTKIKKVSELSGMSASEISAEISVAVEAMLDENLIRLTQEMLLSCGVNPSLLATIIPRESQLPNTPIEFNSAGYVEPLESLESTDESTGWGETYTPPSKQQEPLEDDLLSATASTLGIKRQEASRPEAKGASGVAAQVLNEKKGAVVSKASDSEDDDEAEYARLFQDGGSEDSFEEMDQVLPDDLRDEFTLPGDTEMGALKDKNGNNTGYSDDFMNDIQSEFGEDFGDEISDPSPSQKKNPGHIPSDVGDNELDVLPVDLGIKSVSAEKGNTKGADFFMAALNGQTGDRSQRNQIKRVRRQQDDY